MVPILVVFQLVFLHCLGSNSKAIRFLRSDQIQSLDWPTSDSDFHTNYFRLTRFPEFPDIPENSTDDSKNVSKVQIVNWKHRWPQGKIVYDISPQFNESSKALVLGAMAEISRKTCIIFQPRRNEADFVYFQMDLGDGCYSRTGMYGGKQVLNLDPRKCIQHGKIVHELLHTVGFHHEHQRPDRDEHIEILWDNIKDEDKDQFDVMDAPLGYLHGFPYDYESILHYGPISFFLAKDIGKPVLKAKGYEPNMGQRVGMSAIDVWKVNLLYNCNNR